MGSKMSSRGILVGQDCAAEMVRPFMGERTSTRLRRRARTSAFLFLLWPSRRVALRPLSALSALPLPDLSSLPPLWRRALQMRSRTRPPTRRQAKHLWSSLDAKVTVTRTGRDGTLHATMTPPWALARRDRARGERRQGAGSVLARGIGRCSRPEPRARPRPRRGSPYCTWRNRVVEP